MGESKQRIIDLSALEICEKYKLTSLRHRLGAASVRVKQARLLETVVKTEHERDSSSAEFLSSPIKEMHKHLRWGLTEYTSGYCQTCGRQEIQEHTLFLHERNYIGRRAELFESFFSPSNETNTTLAACSSGTEVEWSESGRNNCQFKVVRPEDLLVLFFDLKAGQKGAVTC